MLKKSWEINTFKKGIGSENKTGYSWLLQNVDIDSIENSVIASNKLFEETNSNSLSSLGENYWSTIFDGRNYSISKSGKCIREQGGSWTLKFENEETNGGLGLFGDSNIASGSETGTLYCASDLYAGRHKIGWSGVEGDWQSFKTTNNGNLCPITKFLKFICFGNRNYLATWDIGASSWVNDKVTFPEGHNIIWMKPISNYLVICTYHETDGAMLYFWDGISQTYNDYIAMGKIKIMAGEVEKGVIYMIGSNGAIYYLNEGSISEPLYLPDALNNTSTFNVHPDAFKFFNGSLYIGLNNYESINRRLLISGIWKVNFDNKSIVIAHTLSSGSVYNNIIYSIMIHKAESQYKTLRVAWKDSSDVYRIDNNGLFGGAIKRKNKYNSIIVTPLFDNEPYLRKRFMQMAINFNRKLSASKDARIIIKYNTSEEYYKSIVSATSGDEISFNLSTANSANVNVGDEVTIIDGTGSGQIRKIVSKTYNSLTTDYTFIVDEELVDNLEYSSTSILQISEFTEIADINGEDFPSIINKLLKFHVRAKKIQFKIEIRNSSSSDVGISNITTIYVTDKIIK